MTQVGQPGHQNKIALQLLKGVSYIICASVACKFDLQCTDKAVRPGSQQPSGLMNMQSAL